MIQLKKEMIEAIAEAVERAGSQMEFERKSGIRQSTINKILNGKSRSIADRTWRDLLPYLDSSRIVVGNTFGSNCRIQSDNNFLPFEKDISKISDMSTPMEKQMLSMFRNLSYEEQAQCIAMIAANFPEHIKEKMK